MELQNYVTQPARCKKNHNESKAHSEHGTSLAGKDNSRKSREKNRARRKEAIKENVILQDGKKKENKGITKIDKIISSLQNG